MIVALLSVLSVGVFSATGSCMAGWKLKAVLTNLKCTSATASAAVCTNCCEKDTTKCGGNTVVCASGKYLDSTKAGMAGGANDAARKTACCTADATCAMATCGPGMKAKTSAAAMKCGSTAASCLPATCCEKDTAKCGGNTVVCASGKYLDSTKADMAGGANDAARKTACCTAAATCAMATCGPGMKANTSAAATKCTSNAASCLQSTCCEFDTTKCGGRTVKFTCAATDVAKAADTAGTTKALCCMTKPVAPIMATCDSFKKTPVTAGAQKTAMSLLFAVAGVVALWK
jgi:hypothetical protein